MSWKFLDGTPVFLQIAKRLRVEIVTGKYPPDTQFPTVRSLTTDSGVNPNTVQRALALLEEWGLLYTKGTVGRFVTADVGQIALARQAMLDETLGNFLTAIEALGITRQEIISELTKREENIR